MVVHAAYLDEIEPTQDEIDDMEWDADNADELEEYEGEHLSALYFEEI